MNLKEKRLQLEAEQKNKEFSGNVKQLITDNEYYSLMRQMGVFFFEVTTVDEKKVNVKVTYFNDKLVDKVITNQGSLNSQLESLFKDVLASLLNETISFNNNGYFNNWNTNQYTKSLFAKTTFYAMDNVYCKVYLSFDDRGCQKIKVEFEDDRDVYETAFININGKKLKMEFTSRSETISYDNAFINSKYEYKSTDLVDVTEIYGIITAIIDDYKKR